MPLRMNFRNRHYLRFHCMHLSTAKEVFTYDFWTSWSEDKGKGFVKLLTTQNGNAVLVSSRPNNRYHRFSKQILINCIDLSSGKIKWHKEIGGLSFRFSDKCAAFIDTAGFLNILSTDKSIRLSLKDGENARTKLRIISPEHYVSLLPYLKLQVLYPKAFPNLRPDGIYDNCFFSALCPINDLIIGRSKKNGKIQAYDLVSGKLKWKLDDEAVNSFSIRLQDKDMLRN